MKKRIFEGTATALVTPMKCGEIDYGALKGIIDIQIESGIKTLVIGGTTGEAATLTDTERERLYKSAREYTDGRAKLIFGCGTNDTAASLRLMKMAEKIGCDGALVVTPYYNKGTPNGVTKHYLALANCTDLPIIVYNVPSRTGVNLTFSQLETFAECDKILGIKEATDSLERFTKIASFGDALPLYSGNDSSTFAALALGGAGVISVISNVFPRAMASLTNSYFSGQISEARRLNFELFELMGLMFCDTNPVPIKYAMSLFGLCSEEVRLPLAPLDEPKRELLRDAIYSYIGKPIA